MTRIKSTGPGSDAGMQSIGDEYMVQVSRKTAACLCGMYPTPCMGCEVCVAIAVDQTWSALKHRLMVANISGDYFVQSSSVKVADWPNVFKVEVQS